MISTWTQRQIDINRKWFNTGMKGLLVGYTAFGKSSGISIPIIQEYKPQNLIIAVPKIRLKLDWEEKLRKIKVKGQVIVVNTLIKNTYECDLFIVDEIHRFGGEEFIKTFENVKYKHILGLTASIERGDGREKLILEKIPLLETVTLEEGLEKGWIDPFEVRKIPINLTPDESKLLEALNNEFEEIKLVLGGRNPMKSAEIFRSYIDINKWCIGKKTKKIFFKKSVINEIGEEKFNTLYDKYFDDATKIHPYYLKAVAAIKFYKVINARKDLLYNAENKIQATLDLLEEFEDEYKFVFAQRIAFIKRLAEYLPKDKFLQYHTEIKTKDKEKAFNKFNDGRTKVKTLLSVKSLVEGIDIPKLSVSIVTSYNQTQIDKIQTFGRTMRKYKDKKAIIIYLYVKDSQEEKWMESIFNPYKKKKK